MKRINLVFLTIIIIGLILRLYKINIPLLEFYPTRQVQTAEIARNFYREGFNLLKPSVHYYGPGQGLFLIEFPGYNFAVAFLYAITGGIHEYLGRLLSITGWIFASILLYQLAKKYIGRFGASVAIFFYTFSPLSILISRSFQPDQWMLTFSLAAIYFLDKWSDDKKLVLFYLSAVFAAFSLLLKIPSMIFTLIPVAFILNRSKVKLTSLKSISYLSIAVIPAMAWYIYAFLINREGLVMKGAFSLSNWFGPEVFLNPKYYSNIFGFEYNLVLLPVGIILFLTGIASKLKRGQSFLYCWLTGIILYFLIFNKHNMTHEYYHLPFLPIASIFIAIGAKRVADSFDNLIVPKNLLLIACSLLLFILMLPSTLARAYSPIDRFKYVPETGVAIKKLTKPNDLIIGAMDAGPALVYYANRTGWGFEINRQDTKAQFAFYGVKDQKILDPIDDLENLRSKGAKIFASADKNQVLSNKIFAKYIFEHYKILEETDNYVIFDLISSESVK